MSDVVPNSISAILKKRRELSAFPFTFGQVAAVADVSKNTVWNLAQGAYWPKLDTAYKVARALNTTVYEIWGEAEILSFLHELSEIEQRKMMEELASEIAED